MLEKSNNATGTTKLTKKWPKITKLHFIKTLDVRANSLKFLFLMEIVGGFCSQCFVECFDGE